MTPAEPRRNRQRPPRPYHASGHHSLTRALPGVLERVADPSLPDEALTPLEAAARAWRRDVLDDMGGRDAVPAARRALLDAATGSMIVLTSLDRYLFTLAARDGLVNKRSRRLFAIVEQRQRVADSLVRQLTALGLERRERPALSLADYLHERERETATTPTTTATPAGETDDASDRHNRHTVTDDRDDDEGSA